MADQIRTEEGYLTELGVALGERRMHAFMTGHGKLQAMALFLVMGVTAAPQAGYSDAALDAIVTDANDLRDAAAAWAHGCVELAEQWRRQRVAEEARQATVGERHG